DEADIHPHRNVLLRVLGTEADVDVDESQLGLMEGDRLLLCSDGLTNMITDEQIQAILEATSTPQEAADRLVRAANRAGGVDNITVVVLDAVEGDDDAVPGGAEPGEIATQGPAARSPRSTPPDLRRLRKPAIALAAAVVVLLASYTGVRTWLDTRWYLGVTNGHVAIFQGIPAEILGFRLSEVDMETEIPALDVVDLPLYADLADGINVDSREQALERIEQIRQDLTSAERGRDG
ncbi:MAG TPA: SpoIIE family protein phosphatase, partial [Actinomycetota bacterium]